MLDIVYGQIFNIRSNDYRVDTGDNIVRVLTNQGVVKMNFDRIPNKDCLGKYNTFVSHAISGNVGRVDSMGQQKIFGKHGILKPNEACSDTYLVIGNFNTIDEAVNCDKYLCSKFARLLVLMRLKSTIMSPKVFTDVPLQDFTSSSDIDWTQSIQDIDKQLYKKYNLSKEEIDYIERTIKPMA